MLHTIYYSPSHTQVSLLEQLNDTGMFNLLRQKYGEGQRRYTVSAPKTSYPNYPKMSHYLTEDGVSVYKIAITDFSREDIDANFNGNTLRITATKQKEDSDEVQAYFCDGIATRSFDISFTIHPKLDIDQATSNIANGILEIRIPIKEGSKPITKKLEIK